jgi:hypothetical protein
VIIYFFQSPCFHINKYVSELHFSNFFFIFVGCISTHLECMIALFSLHQMASSWFTLEQALPPPTGLRCAGSLDGYSSYDCGRAQADRCALGRNQVSLGSHRQFRWTATGSTNRCYSHRRWHGLRRLQLGPTGRCSLQNTGRRGRRRVVSGRAGGRVVVDMHRWRKRRGNLLDDFGGYCNILSSSTQLDLIHLEAFILDNCKAPIICDRNIAVVYLTGEF